MLLNRSQRGGHGIVIEGSISDKADHGPFRIGSLYSERSRKTCSQAADAAGEEGSRFKRIEISMDRQAMSDGLFHDYAIGGKHLAYLVRHPASIHRLRARQRHCLLAPLFSPRLVFVPQFLGAAVALGISLRNSLFERRKQMFQRTFDFTRQT